MQQHWIHNKRFDLAFICLPTFLPSIIISLFPNFFAEKEVSIYWWIFLVLFIDVSHVYTTLYKTYFDNFSKNKHKKALIFIPIICFSAASILYAWGNDIFWTALAYIAVYHFIKQQYGFIKIYRRNDTVKNPIDIFAVYAATIYPILYWHIFGPFNFNWFTSNDFVFLQYPYLNKIFFPIYILVILIYFTIEINNYIKFKSINIAKNLILLGTILSWYLGIIYFNNDLIFTILNVVTHGIPYMALVWLHGKKTAQTKSIKFYTITFKQMGFLLFLSIPFVLAFVEEGLWDALLWQERKSFFEIFYVFNNIINTNCCKPLIISFLILPQLTHYVLDGFIWKIRNGDLPTSERGEQAIIHTN